MKAREQRPLVGRVVLGGPDWAAIKEWLEIEQEIYLVKLYNSKTHDESQKLRGAIEAFEKLLLVEKDAKIASNQG